MTRLPELAVFIGLIIVSFAFGPIAFYRALGALAAFYGLFLLVTGRPVPVGVEGRKPSFHLTGRAARFAGLAVLAVGAALAWFAPQAACIFSEGRQCS